MNKLKQRFRSLQTRLSAACYCLTSQYYIGIGWSNYTMAYVAHNNTPERLHLNLQSLANMAHSSMQEEEMEQLVQQANAILNTTE